MDGVLGLHGWQWLFLIEGAPSVLLGLVTLLVLPDRPTDARWLNRDEANWLVRTIEAEQSLAKPVAARSTWQIMLHPQVLLLSLIYAGSSARGQRPVAVAAAAAQGVRPDRHADRLINAVPFFFASIAMLLWGRRSDRTRERVWSTLLPAGPLGGSAGRLPVRDEPRPRPSCCWP